jgi:hypothetical protein
MDAQFTIARPRDEMETMLATPGEPMLPALFATAKDPALIRDLPATRTLFESAPYLDDLHNIPHLTYTVYRDVQRKTDRFIYQRPRNEKRTKTWLTALQVLCGKDEYLNLLHDYLWSMCEETVWVLPQVEHWDIELRVAATVFDLAEIVVALEDRIEERVRDRIRAEIERRVFAPYLDHPEEYWWYRGHNNWNGVCNGGIGAAFLLLEEDTTRLAQAMEVVLEGLDVFLATGFEADGTSTEGVGYWSYGTSNLICFAEMLRLRTSGEIDILATDRVKTIATYPQNVMVSPGRYFSFSDCNEETAFGPGLVTRLAERTGVSDLLGVLTKPAGLAFGANRFHTLWRNLLWWDGTRPEKAVIDDVYLASSGVTRLTATVPDTRETAVVLAAKAGHNGVPHNHNDVGTFVLNVDGETLLCDPERGLYDNYKKYGHDQVIFSNSYGHSLPVINGQLQSRGTEFAGEVARFIAEGKKKRVEMELSGAYEVPGLERVQRSLRLSKKGTLTVEDTFAFGQGPLAVQEAFVTWFNTLVSDQTALIVGERHILELTIQEPAEAVFVLELLEEESKANHKTEVLKRLSFECQAAEGPLTARVRIRVLPQ